MNTIMSLTINYVNNGLVVTLDDGLTFELAFSEISKLNNALPNTIPNLGNRRQDSLFTPAIKAAVDGKIINYTEALMVVDYSNRGYANPNNTVTPNLLKDKFPEYWVFLEQYRTAVGDPNAI